MDGISMFQTVLNIIYPRRCPICSEIVVPKGEKACPMCKDRLNKVKEPRCKKCSKPIETVEAEYCYDCTVKDHHYKKGFALWVYDKTMKKSISNYKYNGKKEYADFYIEEMLNHYTDEIYRIKPDAIIPIPIHKSKRKIRGFNQTEIIAKGIAKHLDIPVLTKTLIRVKKTLPQKELNDKERLKNLKEAFSYLNEEIVMLDKNVKKIFLIDDIYTTGSTIEACTSILQQNGIEEVYFLCVCIGKGF